MARTRDDDACPGALHVHHAADGALARIRLPGGVITGTQLEALADAADRFGAGTLELTARGNVQVRGITDTTAVADAVAAAGLLPSPTHELVRNIVASPLSGRLGGRADVRPWVGELDHALQADPVLAGLPGRFLFSIDDGSADVSGLAADVGVHVVDDGVALLMNGRDTGIRLAADEAVTAMITVAARFAESRGTAWRIKELDDPGALVAGFTPVRAPVPIPAPPGPPVGWIEQDDGQVALGAAVPLGVLSARQAQFVAAMDALSVGDPFDPASEVGPLINAAAVDVGEQRGNDQCDQQAPRRRATGPDVQTVVHRGHPQAHQVLTGSETEEPNRDHPERKPDDQDSGGQE